MGVVPTSPAIRKPKPPAPPPPAPQVKRKISIKVKSYDQGSAMPDFSQGLYASSQSYYPQGSSMPDFSQGSFASGQTYQEVVEADVTTSTVTTCTPIRKRTRKITRPTPNEMKEAFNQTFDELMTGKGNYNVRINNLSFGEFIKQGFKGIHDQFVKRYNEDHKFKMTVIISFVSINLLIVLMALAMLF